MSLDATTPALGGEQAEANTAQQPHALRDVLNELLDQLASDPEAGAWSEWALKLRADDQPAPADEVPTSPASSSPDDGDWRPRKPR